jgi:arginase
MNEQHLSRRVFLSSSAVSAFGLMNGRIGEFNVNEPLTASERGDAISGYSEQADKTYHILGVPLRTGSLYPGSENDAQSYRDVQLTKRLQAAGCKVVDDGDVAIPSYLPHHAIPPIRSWPGPRVAWDCISQRVTPVFQQPGHVPLLIGCDCSVVIGTTQALVGAAGNDVHVLYVDGDFDDAAPNPAACQSAAAMAVWLLTNGSSFWAGPALNPNRVTMIGWSNPSQSEHEGIGSISLTDIRRSGAREAGLQALAAIPKSASILLHCDIDVFQKRELPAAYFPHTEGITVSEGIQLLSVLLKDPRIRIIEISEYASLRDLDQHWVTKIVDMVVEALKK